MFSSRFQPIASTLFFCLISTYFSSSCIRKEALVNPTYSSSKEIEIPIEESRNKGPLAHVHIIDFNGFSETITHKDRLRQFERRNFLEPQQYKKVLRVFKRTSAGNSLSIITLYHDNGHIYRYLECKNGRAFGNFREWHENGALKISAQVISGHADIDDASIDSWTFDGISQAWSSEGKKIGSFPYRNGLLEGIATTWYPTTGKIQLSIEFKQGEKEGREQHFRLDGSIAEENRYISGKRMGKSERFWPNGTIQAQEIFENDHLINGIYYKQDGVEIVSTVTDGNGMRSHSDDTQIRRQEEIQNGTPNGMIRIFSENGSLQKEYRQQNGKKEGREILYYPITKKPKLSIDWKEGSITGIVQTWYPDGALQSKKEMKHNYKDGLSMSWYNNGDLMFVEEYEKDLLQKGRYHKKGQDSPYSTIENGKGTATLFDDDERLIEKIEYLDGKPVLDQ